MAITYRCPVCERELRTSGGIVLVGESGGRRTLVVFSPEPGEYGMEVADGHKVVAGTLWEFTCPLCGADLTMPFKKRLARLELVEDGRVRMVVFSKVADEQATFVIGGGWLQAHGKDSEHYLKHR